MPPKKQVALSLEEKKEKCVEFLQSQHTFYSLKELEKVIPKSIRSINSMQVKPIIQELIDDNRLNVEKCGLINLYWSFKFDRMKTDIDKFKKLTNELTSKRNQLNQATEDLYDLAIANQQRSTSTIEIQQELDQLNTVERTLIDKANQLEIEYKKSLIQEKTVKLQDSVNFFTNSIELIIYHFTKRNYYINKDDLFALLELPDDFFDDLPKLK